VPPNKKPLIPADDRVKMLKKHFKSQSSKIVVDSWPGLIVDYCAKKEIYSIIRGLRNSADFEIEREMAMMNQSMNIKCETVFLMTHPACSFISSSLVREIYRHGGQVKDYVPLEIYKHLEAHKAKYVS
jgi:pantetheine-phosphate adenylyltransferase